MFSNKKILVLVVGILFISSMFALIGWVISFKNKEVVLSSLFNQKLEERTSVYDNTIRVISKNAKVSTKSTESLKDLLSTQVDAQKPNKDAIMTWVKNSNPTATFEHVNKLYIELSRTIESMYTDVKDIDVQIQDVKREHKVLISKFPNSLLTNIFGIKELKYTQITSDRTREVISTGVDNDFDVEF